MSSSVATECLRGWLHSLFLIESKGSGIFVHLIQLTYRQVMHNMCVICLCIYDQKSLNRKKHVLDIGVLLHNMFCISFLICYLFLSFFPFRLY